MSIMHAMLGSKYNVLSPHTHKRNHIVFLRSSLLCSSSGPLYHKLVPTVGTISGFDAKDEFIQRQGSTTGHHHYHTHAHTSYRSPDTIFTSVHIPRKRKPARQPSQVDQHLLFSKYYHGGSIQPNSAVWSVFVLCCVRILISNRKRKSIRYAV